MILLCLFVPSEASCSLANPREYLFVNFWCNDILMSWYV